MTEMSPMTPIPVPEHMKTLYPDLDVHPVGPPPGMTEDEVGTVECLVGYAPFDETRQMPVYADFWQPTPDELEMLNNGGVLELRLYLPQLAMHSLNVHPGP